MQKRKKLKCIARDLAIILSQKLLQYKQVKIHFRE